MLETQIRLSGILTDEEVNSEYIFDLSYNPTDGFSGDLWESTKQDLAGDVSQFLRYLSGLDIMRTGSHKSMLIAPQAHADKYKDYIQQGRPVIPVVHSQSNFYLMKLLLNKSKGISIHMFN